MVDTDKILRLAAIIREIDGNHSKGAAALAESILYHPDFRAALADEPAVPEGREPVSVVEEPCDEELLKLARAELNNSPNWEKPEYDASNPFPYEAPGIAWLNFARAVLARWGNPAPQPPAKGEVEELVNALKGIAYWRRHNKPGGPAPAPFDIRQADRLDRAADLLRRLSPPQPVPVSERLPGPSDCAPWPKDSDASAWCWVGTDEDGGWNWEQRSAGCLAMFPDDFTHWLPAHALPLPGQEAV